jgi:ketosteroid isomerase-like protein
MMRSLGALMVAPESGQARNPAEWPTTAEGSAPSQRAEIVATVEPAAEPASSGAPAVAAAAAQVVPPPVLFASPLPLSVTEIEALFAAFVETYERGRLDAFAALFDDDADTNLRHGRAAIRGEYDELFRLSDWRKMQLTRINWRRAGERAYAKGEIAVRIGWRDGREIEQHVAVDMELVRRDGRAVIARLAHQPKPP